MFWMPVGRPTRMMRAAIFLCRRISRGITRQSSVDFIRNRRLSTQDTSWLISVAMAAPATPMRKITMNTRSSTMLVTDAHAR